MAQETTEAVPSTTERIISIFIWLLLLPIYAAQEWSSFTDDRKDVLASLNWIIWSLAALVTGFFYGAVLVYFVCDMPIWKPLTALAIFVAFPLCIELVTDLLNAVRDPFRLRDLSTPPEKDRK